MDTEIEVARAQERCQAWADARPGRRIVAQCGYHIALDGGREYKRHRFLVGLADLLEA